MSRLALDRLAESPRHAGQDASLYGELVDAAHRLAESHFAPLAASLDRNPPLFEDGGVRTIPALRTALDAYVDGGFLRAGFDEGVGGLQLPYTVALAIQMVFTAANNPAAGYLFLTAAAANLLAAHGSPEQRDRYLEPLVSGRFFGTMCLSEAHAGSSLADIRTAASPVAEGGLFRLRGQKMWISGGDQDLSANIVHLVLARIAGAPDGVAGLSLFIVPKWRLGDGAPDGRDNGVRLVGLNSKLGHRGTTNCVLSFGEDGECLGELVGEEGSGLAYMFHMMNEARIGVGAGAAVTAHAAFLAARDYARGRPQGRLLGQRDPASPQVAIVEHADVRRMLLAQRAIAEGSMALCLYCARLVDEVRVDPRAGAARDAGLLLEVLTPIAKTWPSEHGMESNSFAIQVMGGAGYTTDAPVERLFRDQRLNAIHEGTTGIQALDLLRRKIGHAGGRAFELLMARMIASADAAEGSEPAASDALRAAVVTLREVTAGIRLSLSADPRRALAHATDFLEMAGTVVMGWMWVDQLLAVAGRDDGFARGKRAACRYFVDVELPRVALIAERLRHLDGAWIDLDPDDL